MEDINKLDMKTENIVNANIEKIGALFPNVIVESENGKSIDFDLLRQELSKEIVEGNKERYQLIWPGKKEAIVLANTPTTKTLRPVKEKSISFEDAKNIYIEGDNLEALKILQESYLNKIDCIYIDPPYNTGSDLIYNDTFINNNELEDTYQIDENANRLVSNLQSNGKFHSDWLTMMYPRLKLSRNLLTNDGVVFISIDENEYANLKKMCNEIFGENNYIGDVIRKTKSMTNDSGNGFNNQHEYLLIYCKDSRYVSLIGAEKDFDNYKNPDNDPNGDWCSGDPSAKSGGATTYFAIENPFTHKTDWPPQGRYWAFSQSTFNEYVDSGRIKFKHNYSEKERGFIFKRYKKDLKSTILPLDSLFATSNEYMNQVATKELSTLMKEDVFSYPKPVEFIKKLIKSINKKDAIIMDFFAGSSTTAHAVMELNKEDNGSRKYINIQIPEKIENKTTICDVALERIRKCNAGSKLRVYKIDSSNLKDIYYEPNKLNQGQLNMLESNVKEGRMPEDLLTQVILDLGLTLDLKIEEKKISCNKVYFIADNSLTACFDNNIDINMIDEICTTKPLKMVFKEESFDSDKDKINAYEKIKKLSPATEIYIL